MNFTRIQLRSIRIFNAYQYADGHPYICYVPQETGRMFQSARWIITHPGHPFPNTHWRDNGSLVFDVWSPSHDKHKVFIEVLDKFQSLYQCEEVIRTPLGSWMDKNFVDERNQQLKDLLRSL